MFLLENEIYVVIHSWPLWVFTTYNTAPPCLLRCPSWLCFIENCTEEQWTRDLLLEKRLTKQWTGWCTMLKLCVCASPLLQYLIAGITLSMPGSQVVPDELSSCVLSQKTFDYFTQNKHSQHFSPGTLHFRQNGMQHLHSKLQYF